MVARFVTAIASLVSRRGRYWIILFTCLLMALSSTMFAEAPRLLLDTITISTTGQVTFKVIPSSTADPDVSSQPQFLYESADHKYVVFVNPDTIKSVPRQAAFSFDARIKRQKPPDPRWYVYNVVATPVGRFPDLLADVNFKITDPSQESVGILRLPLHSETYDGDLTRKQDDSLMMDIGASDDRDPRIVVQNNLENLGIHVTRVSVERRCVQCWNDPQSKAVDALMPPSTTLAIPLNIRVKPLSAMLSSAFILKRDKPHDILSVTVYYNVDQGGTAKQQHFDVPVRFSPSIWQLAIAGLSGALVGAVLKRFVAQKSTKLSWSFVGRAIFLSLVAEVLAAIAASFDSKVIVLGFDMDPRQVIPAAVLAFAVTGGPPVIKWAVGVINPVQQQQNSAADAAAGGR